MYGNHTNMLAMTGAGSGTLFAFSTSLGLITAGLVLITFASLFRKRNHARP